MTSIYSADPEPGPSVGGGGTSALTSGRQARAPRPTLPTITAAALVAALEDRGSIDELGLISLMGAARHHITVNALEMALVRDNVIGEDELLELTAALSGRTAYPGPEVVPVSDLLDPDVSARHGALVVDRDPLTVAFVEDTDANVAAVATALGTAEFEIWMIVASQFRPLHRLAYHGIALGSRVPAGDLFTILDAGVAAGATDIHLKVGVPPLVRVDGAIRHLPFLPVSRTWLTAQVPLLADERHRAELAETFSTDLAYTFGAARFRVNIAADSQGATMALRQLPSKVPTADDIALPEVIRQFAHLERGLVLVTGPTGSGKSTTLAAILNLIIQTSSRHLITLEDPIEFRLPTDSACLVNQRELGQSFESFPDGIRDALRQDPDVVLIGEMRDPTTIRTALTAAETGHLVFGTLHTYDAASTVARVVNSFPATEQEPVRSQLSQLLRGCVSQTLLPKAGGKGRVAAFEIMTLTPAIAANLRKVDGQNQIKQTMQISLSDGMATMESSLAKLVVSGIANHADALFRARDTDEFTRMLDFYSQQANQARTTDGPR